MLTRRQFFSRSLLAVTAAGTAGVCYTLGIEPHWLSIVQIKMPIRNLPDHLVGKTLLQLSDLHIGEVVDDSYILATFRRAARLEPDFVVYTGDFVSHEENDLYSRIRRLMPHAPKGQLGTAAILGNHDYGRGWSELDVGKGMTDVIQSNGIPVLSNEAIRFEGLTLIGIDDYWSPNYDLETGMQHFDPSEATVVLSHNPDTADQPGWGNYDGWILSGHTHGGQVSLPLIGPPILPQANWSYIAGIYPLSRGRTLYISRGVGYTYRIRFNSRPDITLFTLEKA